MLGIQAPKAEKFHPTVITPAKARELVTAAADDDVWGPCFMLALALGPRQGERLGLCWDDLDLEKGSVRIRRELGVLPWKHGCGRSGCGHAPSRCPQRRGGGFCMMETKSESGARTAALPSQLVAALKRQKAAQARWKVEEGENWVGFVDSEGVAWDLVFTRRTGRPIDNKVDRAAWKEFTEAHGVEGMRVHDARHTAATVLLALGVDPRVVMDVMGWSQSSMLTRYQHVLDEMKVSAAAKVGDALFGGPVSESEPAGGDRVVSLADFRTRRRS
ncbi:tyrosine-type recombinase/integrase [Rothia koreensis]|uniref:tyrosine-type recombinase/integrase n=1 Tax=Rothia koreensis TaxID=592378 RepID=UPI0037C5CB49